jgi:hypothetical protein
VFIDQVIRPSILRSVPVPSWAGMIHDDSQSFAAVAGSSASHRSNPTMFNSNRGGGRGGPQNQPRLNFAPRRPPGGFAQGILRIEAVSSDRIHTKRKITSSSRREIEIGVSSATKGEEDLRSRISTVEIRCGNLCRIREETSTTTTIALVVEIQERYVILLFALQLLISVNALLA